MRELAFLNKGLQINLIDETHAKIKVYESKYSGGITEFISFLDQKNPFWLIKMKKLLLRNLYI